MPGARDPVAAVLAASIEAQLEARARAKSREHTNRPIPASIPEAGALLGLEHEFTLYCGDAKHPTAFADLFPALLAAAGTTVPHAVAPGVHLDDGTLLTIDGDEAEIAIAPVAGTAMGLPMLARRARTAHRELLRLLAAIVPSVKARTRVRGYSTHLSIAMPFVDVPALARRYAGTVAPALMLLLDLPCSPGLLVRPRDRRLEFGGEYLPPDDRLLAAAAFAAASAVQLASARVATADPPFDFATGDIEPAVGRPGWFVPRTAFGADLYVYGRACSLRLVDGSLISAQTVLERTWAWCRPQAIMQLGVDAVQLVDSAVAGRCALPCETLDVEREIDLELFEPERADIMAASAVDEAAVTFRALARGVTGAGVAARLTASGWHRSLIRLSCPGGEFDVEIRRSLLSQLIAQVRDGSLAAVLAAATSSGSGFPRAHSPDATTAGALSVGTQAVTSEWRVISNKKDDDDFCSARLVRKGPPHPTVDISIPENGDTLVPRRLQEPPVNAMRGGAGVFLQNGGLGHEHIDLRVKAIGFDFVFRRCYRSFIEHDGVMGLSWDHGYNQRVVPTRPDGVRGLDDGWLERYTGPETSRSGDLWYFSGTGRRTFHTFASWHERRVRIVDQHGDLVEFEAIVTIYQRNPGERALLQRYAVYEGSLPWGEAVFYTRRGHDGALQVFNCHGALIALRDRHRNTMRFYYGPPVDPGRRYPVLRQIVDTTGRSYVLGYDMIAGSPRITSLDDPFGRTLRFVYSSRAELVEAEAPAGRHAQHRWAYEYAGTSGRLVTVTAPEAAAQGAGPHIEIEYDPDGRVVRQRHGSRDGRTGGVYEFDYAGDWVRVLRDRTGVETEFVFRDYLDSRVAFETSVDARLPAHPPPGSLLRLKTSLDYDDEFQIRRTVRPSGVVEEREWAPKGVPVTVGDERDWVDRNWTVVDNLAAGNLLVETIISPQPVDAPRRTLWRYEPLFNCTERERAPSGTTRWRYDHGWSATPERNGNPYQIDRAPRLQPDGSRIPVVEHMRYGDGGLVAEHIDPDGMRTVYEHDPSGVLNLVVQDADHLALTLRHVTDERGRVRETIDPDGASTAYEYDDRDNLVATTDALSHVVHFRHDHEDRVVDTWTLIHDDPTPLSVTTATQLVTWHMRREYDFLGRIAAETIDAGGLDLRIERECDAEGRVILVRSPRATGGTTSAPINPDAIRGFEYDGQGLLVAETSGVNVLRRELAYDADGHLTWQREPDGALTTYTLNGFGETIEFRDPVGGLEWLERDEGGRVSAVHRYGTAGGPSPTDRTGARNVLLADARFIRDAEGNVVRRSDLEGDLQGLQPTTWLTMEWGRTASGRVHQVVDAAGRRTVATWDTAGRIAWQAEPRGVLLRYDRDDCGRVIATHHERFAPGDLVAPATSRLAGRHAYQYDGLGRLVEESVGTAVTRYAYDSVGRLRAIDGPADSHREYVYDGAGRCVREIVETGPSGFNLSGRRELLTEFDRNGNVTARHDGLGNVTTYTYDEHDRLYSVTAADASTVTAVLDEAGRATVVSSPSGASRFNRYDAAGRAVLQSHQGVSTLRSQSFEYDGLGRCVRATEPDGIVATRAYSLAGRLIGETQDGFSTAYEHEKSGLATAWVYPSATRVAFGRYADGRVETVAADGAELARYRWLGELRRRRTSPVRFDNAATGLTQVREIIERRDHHADGRLAWLAHVAHGPGVLEEGIAPAWRFIYRRGLPIQKLSATHGIELQHDRARQLLREIREPIRDIPDIARRTVVLERDAGGNVRQQAIVTLQTSGSGQVVRIDSDFNAVNAPITRRTTVNGVSSSEAIEWDRDGRLLRNRIGLYAGHPRLPAVPAIRLCSYDGFGRLVEVSLVPDDPAQAPRGVRYRYDAFGRRVERIAFRTHLATGAVLSEEHTRYVFAGSRCIEEHERDNATEPWRLARRFVHGPGPREIVALLVDEAEFGEDIDGDGTIGGPTTLLALQDHDDSLLGLVRLRQRARRYEPLVEAYRSDSLGRTTRIFVDSTGNERPIAMSSTGHVANFHGQWLHEPEGLVWFGGRWYDPELGVFVTPDPLGPWADPLAAGNAYLFAGGSPALATDEGGEVAVVFVLFAVALVGVMIAADVTRNRTLMTFSPAHNLVRAIVGHEIDDPASEVGGFERFLAAIDAPLTILSMGGSALLKAGAARLAAALERGFQLGSETAHVVNGLRSTALATKIAVHEATPLTIRQLQRCHRVVAQAMAAWKRAGHLAEDMIRISSATPHGAVGAYWQGVGDNMARIWLHHGLEFASDATRLRVFAHEAAHVKFAYGLERVAQRFERPLRFVLRVEEDTYRAGVFWLNEAIAYGVEFGTRFDFARALQSMDVFARLGAIETSRAISTLAQRGLWAGPIGSGFRATFQIGCEMAARE